MPKKVENVVGYYVVCNRLKDTIRTGWKVWNVQRERLESVAEHVYSTQMLAISMYSEFKYDIDIRKVIMMLAVHEVGEAVIGDITRFQMNQTEKMILEHKAVHAIFSELSIGNELEELLIEFDERKTKESRFAYMCDKLECDIQCKLYGQQGLVDVANQQNNPAMKDEEVLELLASGKTWEEMWLEFDKRKCSYDANFMEVLDYVMNNDMKLPSIFE